MANRPLFRKISHIGLVVRSVEATARRCWEDFGIGPWTFYTLNPSNVEGMTIHGKRVDHAMRIAYAAIGDTGWEIIEPLDDRSVYADHLRKHGEGIHHVMFDVDNYADAKMQISQAGCQEIVSGALLGHPYSYFNTQDSIACITEIWSPPAAGVEIPPPDGTYP